MLRLLILLECDQCKEMLSSMPNTCHLGIDWLEEIHELEHLAERSGWTIYRSRHVCDACVMNAMAEQHI